MFLEFGPGKTTGLLFKVTGGGHGKYHDSFLVIHVRAGIDRGGGTTLFCITV